MAEEKEFDVSGFVHETLRKYKKSCLVGLIVRIVLLLVVLIYMSWLSAKLSQLDADTVMIKARTELVKKLPGLERDIVAKLKNSAPEIISQLEQRSNEIIPRLFSSFEDRAITEIKKGTADIQEKLAKELDEHVKFELQRIDKHYPNLTSKERLDKLIAAMHGSFRGRVEGSIDTIAVRYRREMENINNWLKRLQSGEGLSQREMYQRDLVAAALKLIEVKTGGGLVKKERKD